jgi:CRP-like cAMP-binding protein
MNGFTKDASPDCISCRFKSSCIFSHLEPGAQKLWNDIKTSRRFTDDDEVYPEGQDPAGIYVVCKGRAKVMSSDARGQQLINWIRHPGETFGHIAYFAQTPYTSNCLAMNDTLISFLDKKRLDGLLDTWPKTYKIFLHKLAGEMRAIQHKLKDTAYKPARSKVARALINAISYKSKDTTAPAIHGLKRTEIAEITGLALETVVRTLQDLEKRHILKRELKSIKILDYATLAKVADPHARK